MTRSKRSPFVTDEMTEFFRQGNIREYKRRWWYMRYHYDNEFADHEKERQRVAWATKPEVRERHRIYYIAHREHYRTLNHAYRQRDLEETRRRDRIGVWLKRGWISSGRRETG